MRTFGLGIALVLTADLVACVQAPAQGPVTVNGTVLDQSGKPVADARVESAALGISVVTDSVGAFSVALEPSAASGGITASAANFASQTHALTIPEGASTVSATWTLHPVSISKQIVLPSAGGPNVDVSYNAPDGAAVTLHIPPTSLADATGNVATGTVNVSLSYWDPLTDLKASPGDLTANPPAATASGSTAPVQLSSFGMATVEISQNGVTLVVAPGATMTETFVLPSGTGSNGQSIRDYFTQSSASQPAELGV